MSLRSRVSRSVGRSLRVLFVDALSLIVLIGRHRSGLIAHQEQLVLMSVSWDSRRWLVVDSPTWPTCPSRDKHRWCGLSRRSSPPNSCASHSSISLDTDRDGISSSSVGFLIPKILWVRGAACRRSRTSDASTSDSLRFNSVASGLRTTSRRRASYPQETSCGS